MEQENLTDGFMRLEEEADGFVRLEEITERTASPEFNMWATALCLRLNDLMVYLGKTRSFYGYEPHFGEQAARLFFGRDKTDFDFMCGLLGLDADVVRAGVARRSGYSVEALEQIAFERKPPVNHCIERGRKVGRTHAHRQRLIKLGATA